MARGVELIRPVSFLLVMENVVDKFQDEPNGLIQQHPEKPIVMGVGLLKLYASLLTPYDQFSASLKSVHL